MTETIELEVLLDRGQRLIAVDSFEDWRVLERAQRIAQQRRLPLYRWSLSEGLCPMHPRPGTSLGLQQPAELLKRLPVLSAGIFVLFDLHRHLADPGVARQLRLLAQGNSKHVCLLVGHAIELPPEFAGLAARYQLPMLSRGEILAILHEEYLALRKERPGARLTGEAEIVGPLIDHLFGLAAIEVRLIVREILRDDEMITAADLKRVFRCKKALLGENGVLSMDEPGISLEELAGMDGLKDWLRARTGAFFGDASAVGVTPPRSILMAGVQGCGKSLAARAVAAAWRIPLLRMDFAALHDKRLGDTVRNFRDSLAIADAMAPCALWLDEIERGMAGEHDDPEVSRQLLGTLLTWLGERKSKVVVIATANDVERLPPGLMPKGCFDVAFFVDLPSPKIRQAILSVHLKRRHEDPAGFDLDLGAARTEGFSGAEIERTIVGALEAAGLAGEPLATAHLVAVAGCTQPLALASPQKIATLRAWAKGRTVPAA